MEYNNRVYLIGRNVELIKQRLGLIEDKNNKKIENNWNIHSHEIKENNINKVFQNITTSLSSIIDEEYEKKTFNFTIIYSLDELNEDKKKENIINLFKSIMEKSPDSYYQPFFILLAKNKKDKDQLDELIKNDITNIGYDIRNIFCFISPLQNDLTDDEAESEIRLIKERIYNLTNTSI